MTAIAVPALSVVETAPLSPGQERLIAAEFAAADGTWPPPGTPTMLRPIDTGAVHITGALDTAALKQAINALTRRQAALRTIIRRLPDGTALQLVLAHRPVPLTHSTLAHWAAGDPDPQQLLHHAGSATVDPRHDPLFRAHLITLQPGEQHVLLLGIHHMISDGWSIGVLYRELSALYNAAATASAAHLSDLPRSFASFSRQMRTERTGARLANQLRYWTQRLAPPLPAPPGLRPAPEPTNPVQVVAVSVAADVVTGLRAVSRRGEQCAGLAAGFLAALAIVVHHATAAGDVRIGMMIANRARPDTEHLIGYFVNTAVIRLTVTADTTAGRLVTAAGLAVTEAITNQALPIQDLIQHLRDTDALNTQPLYDVTVALNSMRDGSLDLHGLDCRDIDMEARHPRQAPTTIAQRWVLEEHARQLTGTLTYRTDIAGEPAGRALLHNLDLAARAVTDRSCTVADIMAGFDPAARASR